MLFYKNIIIENISRLRLLEILKEYLKIYPRLRRSGCKATITLKRHYTQGILKNIIRKLKNVSPFLQKRRADRTSCF